MVPKTPLQFRVAERLSRTFRAESTKIHVEALKMLWADSVSTAYLIYRIPYVPIGLRIPEEEWRGKDTSLAYLKVIGCNSFVKVKDVCGEAMKCTFIGNSSDEMRYSFWDTKSHQVIQSRDITFVDSIYGVRSATNSSSLTKPIQKSQVVLVDIPENLVENDSIAAEHGLRGRLRRSTRESRAPVRCSSSANYLLLTENGEPESFSEALSSKESVQWKKAIIEEMVSLEKNQTCSLVILPAGKKASQSLWMFRQGFSASWAGRKPRVQIEGNFVRTYSSTEAMVDDMLVAGSDMAEFNKPKWQLPLVFEMKNRCSEKHVLSYVLTVGVTTVKWESRLQKSITIYTKNSIHLAKNLKVCSWTKLVRILISEGSLSLLKILRTKSLAEMFTRIPCIESLLALCLVGAACFVTQPQVNPDSTIAQGRHIVVLGLRGGLLGANPIPHRLARGVQFGMDRAVWHEPEQFSSELNNISLV
ncbi:retrovirus-related pol polyprotein from transposon TNT 1-94 [Tanacetum coccineum]